MRESTRIERTSIVNDVIRDHPSTLSVFNYFGVDACCGGNLSIAEAAENEFIDAGALVAALRNSVRHETANSR